MKFHIHINLINAAPETICELLAQGFELKPFANRRPFSSQFTPRYHISRHVPTAAEFKTTFSNAEACLKLANSPIGYVEGEYVAREDRGDRHVEGSSLLSNEPALFLNLMPPAQWRKSEVHITIRKEEKSKKYIEYLRKAGFYWTDIVKNNNEYVIFTAQGGKNIIRDLYNCVHLQMKRCLCIKDWKIKEERSLKYWISNDYTWLMSQVSSFSVGNSF